MVSDEEKKTLLQHLGACFFATTARRDDARTFQILEDVELSRVVEKLSQLERTPGLSTDLWQLLVRAKGVIAGKVKLDAFVEESLKYQGLR